LTEFELIREHFARLGAVRTDVALGVGDDCALLRVPRGRDLAVSIDTLVAGTHFLPDCDPAGLGHKSLAVGLSDLAAMGAEPAWATLALTLPRADAAWLAAFAEGFARLAAEHGVQLVGGDTTRGPLSITVQVHGLVPEGQATRRAGARPGDLVCVSGTLGDAGLALRLLQAREPVPGALRRRLDCPTPRLELGIALRGRATALIDVSDGLGADLGHILEASGVGAEIRLADLPVSPRVAAVVAETGEWTLPLASGDDYELCFTLPAERGNSLDDLARRGGCPVRTIGRITGAPGLRCLLPDGSLWHQCRSGYDHFPPTPSLSNEGEGDRDGRHEPHGPEQHREGDDAAHP
jgi:thiamine-monophosphate kinase